MALFFFILALSNIVYHVLRAVFYWASTSGLFHCFSPFSRAIASTSSERLQHRFPIHRCCMWFLTILSSGSSKRLSHMPPHQLIDLCRSASITVFRCRTVLEGSDDSLARLRPHFHCYAIPSHFKAKHDHGCQVSRHVHFEFRFPDKG